MDEAHLALEDAFWLYKNKVCNDYVSFFRISGLIDR